MNKERLYSSAINKLSPDIPLFYEEHLPQRDKDLLFAMRCNGYYMLKNGQWQFDRDTTIPFFQEFKGQSVSFFGPNSYSDNFFRAVNEDPSRFYSVLRQESVTNVIRKYREIDEDQAARVAFLFGGIVRYLTQRNQTPKDIERSVKFAARMSMLGEERSGDAIASAMAMYIISGGSLSEDRHFEGSVYYMADATRKDPIVLRETKDLGLSQVARLRAFLEYPLAENRPLPDIEQHEAALDGFPTIGAEFHFPADAPKELPNFWQRLAILNMSQYQRGSYVQLSRNDRGVIEVRMNPSIYPITIANWNHIRLLLPELKQTYFTLTINRKSNRDFYWNKELDRDLLNQVRGIGMLCYAGLFDDVPSMEKIEEIDFGQVYLGQTVRVHDGEYEFTGNWSGGVGHYGQLGIYVGYGDNFPHLAYFPSMALANPEVLGTNSKVFLPRIKTLNDALTISSDFGRSIFSEIQGRIEANERLRNASEAGKRIIELLSP